MNITHDMSNDLTEYDPESRQVDGPNPIENRISSSAARVPDIISCTSGITVQGRQPHSFAFTTDAAIIRNTNSDAILARSDPRDILAVQQIAAYVLRQYGEGKGKNLSAAQAGRQTETG